MIPALIMDPGVLEETRWIAEALDVFGRAAPQIAWPRDRTWVLATEIDVDSTYVAGPASVVEAVLADPALEAVPNSDGHTPPYVA